MVASLPWRREPQIQEPWHNKSHGAVDVVGPMTPPGRASGRGDAGVYTDRRKRPLGAVLGHSCTLLRRCGQVRERRSVHKSAKTASRSHFGALVYTVATLVAMRTASGGTSAPTTMTCRRHSLGGHLPLVGKTGSARAEPPLGWRLRRGSKLTQIPEELQKAMGPSLCGQQRVISITWTPGNQRYHRCSLPDGKPSLVSRRTGSHLPMRLSSAGRERRA